VAYGHIERTGLVARSLAATALTVLTLSFPHPAWAASFAAKDLQVLGRAIAFMQPSPAPDTTIAIAYAAGNAASRQDADAIASLIGGGLQAGRIVLHPKVIEINSLTAGGFQVVIAAAGASGTQLSAATRAARALCVTTDIEAVRAGFCAMAITSEPRVEIIVNHAVSAAAGIDFAAAFRMMIREL
jgi:hypothetical protein